jgi:hypothetical protein
MKKLNALLVLIVLFASLAIPMDVSAKPIEVPLLDDKVIVGESFTLESGETLDGSLIVLGGVISLEEGSLVEGDVFVVGGNVTVEGEILNSLVAIGGVLSITDSAVIYGDLIAPATVLKREEGSQVYGQIISDTSQFDIEIPEIPEIPDIPEIEISPRPFIFLDNIAFTLGPVTSVFWFLFRTFAFSAVAALILMFAPAHTSRASKAIVSNPVLAGILGLITIFVACIMAIPMVLVAFTIILLPLSLLYFILFGLTLLYGWVVVGSEVGKRFAGAVNNGWSPALQAGIGTFALVFLVGTFGFMSLGGFGALLGIVISSVGLGAVLLTRFGTRDYIPPPSSSTVSVEPGFEDESGVEKIPEFNSDEETLAKDQSEPKPKSKTKRKSSAKTKTKKKPED